MKVTTLNRQKWRPNMGPFGFSPSLMPQFFQTSRLKKRIRVGNFNYLQVTTILIGGSPSGSI